MLQKDQGPCIFPELLKRFRSKSMRNAIFALFVISEVFKTKTALDDLNLKTVFKAI
jgi:hypothetical protein